MDGIKSLREKDVVTIVQQLIKVIQTLSKLKITMKNFKPNNILLVSTKNLNIQITDVGFSSLYDQKAAPKLEPKDQVWMAPESVDRRNTPKADIWSLGAITYWLLTGKEPLSINSASEFESDLKKLKAAKEFKFDAEVTKNLSNDCVDFLEKTLAYEVNKRATIEQLVNHPWVVNLESSLGS